MPRSLTVKEIEVFRAVMQTGTATAAAQLLHTTQPSISRTLGQMQAGTQLKLFEMRKGRLHATPEATELYGSIQQHYIGLHSIERDMHALRRSGVGTLRIGCTPALGVAVMPAVMRAFLQEHPGAHLSLQTLGLRVLRERLLHGEFDAVVSATPMGTPEFNAEVLHRSRAVCVLHPDHPLAARHELHVRDLHEQPLLTLNAGDVVFRQLQRVMTAHQVEGGAMIETTYSSTICALAAEGVGIGVVNPYVAAAFGHRLAVRPFAPHCLGEVVLSLSPHAALSKRMDRLIALLRERLRCYDGEAP